MAPSPWTLALLKQGGGFIIAGLVNTAASYLCYLGLLIWFNHQIAYAVAFVLGIAASYLLNARFVFRAKTTLRRTVLFPLVYLIQWAIGALLLEWQIAIIGVDRRIAPLFVIIATVPISFLLVRWVMTRT